MSKNELTKLTPTELQIIPDPDELTAIMADLNDMDTLPFGRVQIAAAGAGVFKVIEPGEEEATVATDITAVIIHHHRSNVLWMSKFGTVEDKTPDCMSMDGMTGIRRDTGECVECPTCPYNQFGSADGGQSRGKACKNTRRLFLMRAADGLRPGDVFPMVLHLPSTALGVFDKYRTKLMLSRVKMHGALTKITLKSASNKDGIAYSTPVFEVAGVLAPDEAERVRQYADAFIAAMTGQMIREQDSADRYDDDESLPFE